MRGFSLVELSIVMVILGLLVGGILAGQSLIRASELRSIQIQLDQFQAATNAFRDRYIGLAGDIPNAEQFWGSDDSNSCANGGVGSLTPTTLTCNGNGDNRLSGTMNKEGFRYWQQLSNAGLIEGQFTGRQDNSTTDTNNIGGGTACTCFNGTNGRNQPSSKIAGVGFHVWNRTVGPGDFSMPEMSGNMFIVGKDTVDANQGNFMTASELWNFDTKRDDGIPSLGTVRAVKLSCSDGANSYYLTGSSKACYFYHILK